MIRRAVHLLSCLPFCLPCQCGQKAPSLPPLGFGLAQLVVRLVLFLDWHLGVLIVASSIVSAARLLSLFDWFL